MPYRAELLPLEGKHYGTKVRIYGTPSGSQVLTVWLRDPWDEANPSRRELAAWDEEEQGEPWNTSDNHYETALSLRVAEAIVAAVNTPE